MFGLEALGLVLLADTTVVVTVDGFEVFLAGVLVVYGGYRLISERVRYLFWPGTFLFVGAGWLLVEFGVLTGPEVRQFWPVMLVLFGASDVCRLPTVLRRSTEIHTV